MKHFHVDEFIESHIARYANPVCTVVLLFAAIYFVCVVAIAFVNGRIAEVVR